MSTTDVVAQPHVDHRRATAGDEALRRRLYFQSRDDLAHLPAEISAPLVEWQYDARRQQHVAAHPEAVTDVVTVDGSEVGVITVDHSRTYTSLVDLCVDAGSRRRGIASAAVAAVLATSADRGAETRLHVWVDNTAARSLYERLGFHYVPPFGDGYLSMVAGAPATEVSR